jgi:hypothetical protein
LAIIQAESRVASSDAGWAGGSGDEDADLMGDSPNGKPGASFFTAA